MQGRLLERRDAAEAPLPGSMYFACSTLLSARFQQGLQKSEGERQATVEAHPIAPIQG